MNRLPRKEASLVRKKRLQNTLLKTTSMNSQKIPNFKNYKFIQIIKLTN